MILSRLERVIKDQRGFTLIELLVALAITGLLASGLGMTIFQILSGNAQSTSQMTVVRQVQNAGYWISQDTQMGQTITPGAADGFPLLISWTDWDGLLNEVTYTYDTASEELSREHYIDSVLDATTFVAQHILLIDYVPDGDQYVLTVTASVEGYRPASETRTYEITPRPGS